MSCCGEEMTKIFFDTEFTGFHKNTKLISIGLTSECGVAFYAELTDYDQLQAIDGWVRANVISRLGITPSLEGREVVGIRCNKGRLRKELTLWLAQFEKVEMWSDCLAYNWVLFNDIWGDAFSIPENVYYIPFDICTYFKLKGIDPDVGREEFAFVDPKNKHNALFDAVVIKKCFERLAHYGKH